MILPATIALVGDNVFEIKTRSASRHMSNIVDLSIFLHNCAVAGFGAACRRMGQLDERFGPLGDRVNELEEAMADALYWFKPGLPEKRADEFAVEGRRLQSVLDMDEVLP